jgi:acyl-CoA synthetase (AMP-forming)/AMP-acid ligase II
LSDRITLETTRSGSPPCVWICDDTGVITLSTLLAVHGTAVVVDGRSPAFEADRLASAVSPDLLVMSTADSRLAAWAARRATPVLVVDEDLNVHARDSPRRRAASSDRAPDLGVITSATTSASRVVTLSGARVDAAVRGVCRHGDLRPDDLVLSVAPLHHTLGLITGLIAPMLRGAAIERVAVADLVGAALAPAGMGRPSWCAMSPAALDLVLSRRAFGPDWTPRVLRSSSGPVSPALAEQLAMATETAVLNAYALTEAPGEVSSRTVSATRPGNVGPGTVCAVAVADETGRLVATGHDGEIWIRGPNVAGDALLVARAALPPAAERLVRHGWAPTGDRGVLDAGELVLKGRMGDLINCGGEKIAPDDVETVLSRLPGVADCAAFPVPHRILGEGFVVAVVVEGPDVTPKSVRGFILDHLPPSHNPLRVIVVPAIPRTARGKVARRSLAAAFGLVEV